MPPANHWIVTGNFTADGAVAWRRADGTWSRQIADAGLLADEATAKQLAAAASAAEQREISDPYGIEVYADGKTIDPLTARQRIRANGPTTPIRRPDNGRRRGS
ncbi:MAG: nitrite reductase [Myxococcales bacterium]|nr:nitrite reductase [Myxococcales bacterium]